MPRTPSSLTDSRAIISLAAIVSTVAIAIALEPAYGATPCTAPAKYSRVDRAPFTVSDADVYREACRVARALGVRAIAQDYGIRSSNRLVVCVAFAQKSYRPVFLNPATQGCLRGIALRR